MIPLSTTVLALPSSKVSFGILDCQKACDVAIKMNKNCKNCLIIKNSYSCNSIGINVSVPESSIFVSQLLNLGPPSMTVLLTPPSI